MSARTNEVRTIAAAARELLRGQGGRLAGAVEGLASSAELLAGELDALEHRIQKIERGAPTLPPKEPKPKKGGA